MNQAAVSVKQRQRPDSSRGLFVHIMVRTCGRPCCSTPLLRKIKNGPKPELGAIFYAGEGGRTLTPLELVPKTSASAIPPRRLMCVKLLQQKRFYHKEIAISREK